MNDLKNFSIWTIPFLTICAGLYHLAYWDTFDINGLAYISLGDVIKSFLYPFISAVIMFYIGIIIANFFMPKQFFPEGDGSKTKIGKVLNSRWCIEILLLLWLILIYLLYNHGQVYRWVLWGFVTGYVPWLYLNKIGFLSTTFLNNRIRNAFLIVIIYLPIYSFSSGKINSEMVKNNIKYELITEIKSDSIDKPTDTLKLLGFTGNHYFITNLKNQYTLIIASEKIDFIKYKTKE
jgi:hypothetical protein